MTKNITPKQFRELIENPLPGFKGTKFEYRELVKSLLEPPDVKSEWRRVKNKKGEPIGWEKVRF